MIDDDEKEFPFKLEMNTVEVGNTYPLYGMITKIVSESPDFVVMINDNIRATLIVDGEENKNLVKARTLEPGIFVSTVTEIKNDPYEVVCTVATVVFGKRKQEYDA